MGFLLEAVDSNLIVKENLRDYMLGGDHVDTVGIFIVPNMTTTRSGSDALLVAIDEFSFDKDMIYLVRSGVSP